VAPCSDESHATLLRLKS